MPGDLLLFLTTRIKKMVVWKTTFASELKHQPVPIDQVFCTRCMLCLLQSWRCQLTALPDIGVGASKFLGVQRIFAQNFPNLPKKLSCNFYRPFLWCDLQQNGRYLFVCKPWAPFFEVKQRWAPFLPKFSGILLDFQQIKTFGGALAPPAPLPSTPLLPGQTMQRAQNTVNSHVLFQTRTHWQ